VLGGGGGGGGGGRRMFYCCLGLREEIQHRWELVVVVSFPIRIRFAFFGLFCLARRLPPPLRLGLGGLGLGLAWVGCGCRAARCWRYAKSRSPKSLAHRIWEIITGHRELPINRWGTLPHGAIGGPRNLVGEEGRVPSDFRAPRSPQHPPRSYLLPLS
jgi:hypothetical protein